MGTRAKYHLTEAGYRITDLMRAGVIPMTGSDYRPRVSRPSTPCPVCRVPMWLTPSGLIRAHSRAGRECPGTGKRVTR